MGLEAFSLKGKVALVTGAKRGGARLVTFENGAKVSVKLGSRRIAKDEAIMTWTDATRPANLSTLTFKGVFDNRIVPLAKRDDGLYMPRGFMDFLKIFQHNGAKFWYNTRHGTN